MSLTITPLRRNEPPAPPAESVAPGAAKAPAKETAPKDGAVVLGAPPAASPETPAAPAPADLSKPPLGLEGLAYGSTPDGQVPLIRQPDSAAFINGASGTPPEVMQIVKGGGGNLFNPQWAAIVAEYAAKNGGLGNEQDGFLAWSENEGFVRLKNHGLSPEQNRRLAAISLQTGWSVEDLPSRTGDSALADPKVSERVDQFTQEYDQKLGAFLMNPQGEKLQLKCGRRRYVMEFNEQAGGIVSTSFKKRGGFAGFAEKALKVFGPVANVISGIASFFPGVGTAIAVGLQALKTAFVSAVTGKVSVSGIVDTVASFFLPAGLKGATPQAAALLGAARVAGEAIDTGKVSASGVAGALTPLISGLPGGSAVDQAVRQAAMTAAKAIDGGRVGPSDLAGVLTPLLGGLVPRDAREALGALAGRIDAGQVSAADAGTAIGRLLDGLTGDAETDRFLGGVLETVLNAVGRGEVSATDVLGTVVPYILSLTGLERQPAEALAA